MLIVDATSVAASAYFAGNSDYFYDLIERLAEEYQQKWFVFCFDNGDHGHRKVIYSAYKANRQSDPQRREFTLRIAYSLVESNLPVFLTPEADDGVASVCAAYPNLYKYILTKDKDLFQLVDAKTVVLFLRKFNDVVLVDEGGVFKDLGVRPDQIALYKAIAGDSDNIPGVRGLGPVAARSLVLSGRNLTEIRENAPSKYAAKLGRDFELAETSLQLAKLKPQWFTNRLTKFDGFKVRVNLNHNTMPLNETHLEELEKLGI